MTELGRRERKKAQTRALISDTATRLFLERGFDRVTVKEIADAADVSPTTVFTHFPTKEALVFDESPDQEAALVAAVRDRAAGVGVLDALETYLGAGRFFQHRADPEFQAFLRMVDATPSLRDHERAVLRHQEAALAGAIAEDGAEPQRARALARFVMGAVDLARDDDAPREALAAAFQLLRAGWEQPVSNRSPRP